MTVLLLGVLSSAGAFLWWATAGEYGLQSQDAPEAAHDDRIATSQRAQATSEFNEATTFHEHGDRDR